MKFSGYIWFCIFLVGASAVFLLIERLTHIEFMYHLAAIPLEILLAVFIVERLLQMREQKKRQKNLMFIKSCMFRSVMRNLFITNFEALKSPPLTILRIKNSTLEELRQMRREASYIEYKSLEAMEPVIDEYVRAEPVWQQFREWAITYDFESIFHNMIHIIHFIYDVKSFKERNTKQPFIYEAEKRPALMEKVKNVLGDGVRYFLDYAIELKGKQPHIFDELISDYEIYSQIEKTTAAPS